MSITQNLKSYIIGIVLIHLCIQGTECRNCGSSPNIVHLSRDEKRRIEFWSDEKEERVSDPDLAPELAALRFSASDPAEMPENRDVVNVDEPVIESKDFLHPVENQVDKPQADSLTLDNIVEKNANDSQLVPTTDLVNHESHEDISVTTEVSIDQTEASLQRNINKQTLHIDFDIKDSVESDFVTTTSPEADSESTNSVSDFKLRSDVEDSTEKFEGLEFVETSSQTEVPESATLGDFQETSDQEGFTETSSSIISEGKHASNRDGLPVTTDPEVSPATEVPQEDSFKFFPVILSEDVIQEDSSSPSSPVDLVSKHSEQIVEKDQFLARTEFGSTEDSTEGAVEGVNNEGSFTNEIKLTKEDDFATERAITREDQIWQGLEFAPSTDRAPLDVTQDTTEINFLDSVERNLLRTETSTEPTISDEEVRTEVNLINDPEDLRFNISTEPAFLQNDLETNTESDSLTEPFADSFIEKLIQTSPLSEDKIWQGTNLDALKANINSVIQTESPNASSLKQAEPLFAGHILPGTENNRNAVEEVQTLQESEIISPNVKTADGSEGKMNVQSFLSEDQISQGSANDKEAIQADQNSQETEDASPNISDASGAEERQNSDAVLSEDQILQGNDIGGSNSNVVSNTADEIFEVTAPSLAEEDVTEVIETKSLEKNIAQDTVMPVMTVKQAQGNAEMPTTATVEDSLTKENDSDAENLESESHPSNEDILFHIKNIISTFSRRDDSAEAKNTTTRNKFFGLERFFLRRSKRSKPVDPFFEIPAPDLSSSQHEKKLTSEQEQLFHSFMKETGSHMIDEEDKIEVKEDLVDVKVTGVLPFGPSVSQPTKLRGTVDTVVGKINPRWRRGEESWLSRLKSGLARFMESRPLPLRRALLLGTNGRSSKTITEERKETTECDWKIKTDPGLYLLVTFHNLSAPYTLDCHGAYIEVEREANGFEARWCGNKIGQQRGTRSHVIFARSEVRISVFDDGTEGKSWPTGFSAEAEVIDLHDAGHYSSFRRSDGYSSVSRLMG